LSSAFLKFPGSLKIRPSSDIYLHLVFLAFAPSFWQDCEMKSWTANTCIPSGVFAFFSHLRHQNEKTNLHFFDVFWIFFKIQICLFILIDLFRRVVFWIFSPLFVWQSCGLHLHHIGLRHYSLSHLIKVPRVRKHISK
jgi:hypothetical protein